MNKKLKNNKNTLDDKEISEDFFEVFDKPDNFDLGSSFVEARAKHGLTQEMAAKSLKVRSLTIQKFENGQDLDISGTAYQIGFIRSYAKLVGLNADKVIESYKKLNFLDEKPLDYNFPSAVQEKKSIIPLMSLVIFLFALISYSSWYYLNITKDTNIKARIADNPNNQNKFSYVKIEEEKSNLSTTKREDNNSIDKNISVEDEIANLNNNKSNVDTGPNQLKTIVETNTNEVSAVANERDPDTEMVLKSTGNSWVEIEDVDGNSFLTRLMRPGETFVIPRQKGLTLSTGNAGVLSLTYGSIHISNLGAVGEVISSRPLNIEAFKNR